MELSNKELGKYLCEIRTALGYSTYDVNKLCNISQSYLSLVENGKRKPSAIILKKLAPIYNLNYLDLYEKAGFVELMEEEQKEKYTKLDYLGNPVVSIPLLGTVKAGYNYLADENWVGTVDIKEELAKTGEFFALKIKGNSMNEALWENDVVAVKKQDYAENGDLAVVIINGDEGAVKKIKKTDAGLMLISFNPDYEPLFFTEDEIRDKPVIIVGVVKCLIEREF